MTHLQWAEKLSSGGLVHFGRCTLTLTVCHICKVSSSPYKNTLSLSLLEGSVLADSFGFMCLGFEVFVSQISPHPNTMKVNRTMFLTGLKKYIYKIQQHCFFWESVFPCYPGYSTELARHSSTVFKTTVYSLESNCSKIPLEKQTISALMWCLVKSPLLPHLNVWAAVTHC